MFDVCPLIFFIFIKYIVSWVCILFALMVIMLCFCFFVFFFFSHVSFYLKPIHVVRTFSLLHLTADFLILPVHFPCVEHLGA